MKNSQQPIEVALVEDNVIYLNELRLLLSDCPDFNLTGHYTHGKEALEGIISKRPDVVLIDLELPDISGVDVIETVSRQGYPTEFLVLTVYDDDKHLFAALQAGALGYIVKGATSLSEIAQSIHEVVNGGAPMSREIAKRVLDTFRKTSERKRKTKFDELTKREVQILEHISRGYSTRKIADELNISYDTVRTHLKNIYQKLHVHTLVEAMAVYNEEK